MKLREGGVYRSADGSLVTIPLRRVKGERHYPFTDGSETWTEDGRRLQGCTDDGDLVEELNPIAKPNESSFSQRINAEAKAQTHAFQQGQAQAQAGDPSLELHMLRIKVAEHEARQRRDSNTIDGLRLEIDLLQRTVAHLAVSNRRLTDAYNLGQSVGSAIRRASRSLAAMFQPCKKGI